MLRIVFLGAGAGGGVPQWNCGCPVCRTARNEHPELQSTQASIAVSADREHCFAVDALRIEKRIVPGKATVVELTPERAGTYPFQCCVESGAAAEKEHGRLVVVE